MQKDTAISMQHKIRGWSGRIFPFFLVALIAFALGVKVTTVNLPWSSSKNPQNTSLPDHLDYSSIDPVYQILKKNYDGKLTENQLIDGMKKGLLEATGDPYSVYF